MLVAWGLKLAAWSLNRLVLDAWSLGLSFRRYAVKLLLSPCIAYAILYNTLDV